MDVRITAAPSLVLDCVLLRKRYGCGDCFSLFTSGFCQNLFCNRRKKLHTFLLLFLASGAWRDKTYNNVKHNYINHRDSRWVEGDNDCDQRYVWPWNRHLTSCEFVMMPHCEAFHFFAFKHFINFKTDGPDVKTRHTIYYETIINNYHYQSVISHCRHYSLCSKYIFSITRTGTNLYIRHSISRNG